MLSDFKAGGFERIQVMPSNIFFAGKFPEMQMTPAQCGAFPYMIMVIF